MIYYKYNFKISGQKGEIEMQDKIIKFLAYEGKISVICADTTELVEKARKIHDLSPVATAAFGRLLTITAIMGNEMKGKDNKERSAMLEFASFTQKEIESYGMDALKEEMLFNEEEALKTNLETIKSLTKVNNIEIVEYQDSLKPKTAREPAMPGKPLFVQA